MILKLFSVYDNKAQAYLPPFAAVNAGVALRMFRDSATAADHMFTRYPLDYHLFEMGTFDDVMGKVEAVLPHNLGPAAQFTDSIAKVVP
ncbi:MAG: nonstructural protein [Microvirus sp.]|nr:MAG: nonstructural protein [Microvirus sp.]